MDNRELFSVNELALPSIEVPGNNSEFAGVGKNCSTGPRIASFCSCPVCGGNLISIRAKLQCEQCHTICETCCEGGRG